MADSLDPTPEELLRQALAPSDGRTPAGMLGLIQALALQSAQKTGAALPAKADQHRPELVAERSGKIVVAESLAVHAIDQIEAENSDRVAERDRLVIVENVAKLVALNTEAIGEFDALLAEMAAAGFAVKFDLKPAAAVVRPNE